MSVCPDLKLYEKDPRFIELCSWYPGKSHQWIADALATWRDLYPQHNGPDSYPIKSAFTRFMNHSLERARFATASNSSDQAKTKQEAVDAYSSLLREYTGQQLEDRVNMIYSVFHKDINRYKQAHPGIDDATAIAEQGGVLRIVKAIFDDWNNMTADYVAAAKYKLTDADPDDIKERKLGAATYWTDEVHRMYRNRNRLVILFLAKLKEIDGIESVYNGVELDIDSVVSQLDEKKENKRRERIEKLKLQGLSDEEAEERESASVKGDRYVDFRTLNFDSTVGIETRKIFNNINRVDADGNFIRDDMGGSRRLDFRTTVPVLRELLLDVDAKDMMKALKDAQELYPWMSGLVKYLEHNKDAETLIFRDCKKAQQHYITVGTQYDGKTLHDSLPNSSASGKSLAKNIVNRLTSGTVSEKEVTIVDELGRIRVNTELLKYKYQSERDQAPDTPGVDKFGYKNVHGLDHVFRLLDELKGTVSRFNTQEAGTTEWGKLVDDFEIEGYTTATVKVPWATSGGGVQGGRAGLEKVLEQIPEQFDIFTRICRGIGLDLSAEELKAAALTPIPKKNQDLYDYAPNRLVVVIDAVQSVINKARHIAESYAKEHEEYNDVGYNYHEARRLITDIDNELAMLDRTLNVTQYDSVEPDATIGNKHYGTYIPINLLHETFDRIGRIMAKESTKRTPEDIAFLRKTVDRYKQCEGFTVDGEPIGFIKFLDNVAKISELREKEEKVFRGEEAGDTEAIDRKIDECIEWNNKFTLNDRKAFKLWDNLVYNDVEYGDMTDAQHQTLSLRRYLNQNAVEIPIQSDYEVAEYLQCPIPVGHDNWVDLFTDEVLAEAERISRLLKYKEITDKDKSKKVLPTYESEGAKFHVFPEMNSKEVLDELAKYADNPVELRNALRTRVEKLLAEYYVRGMQRLVGDDNFILDNPNLEKPLKDKLPAYYKCDSDGRYVRTLYDEKGAPVKDSSGNEVKVEDKSSIKFKDSEGNWFCYREFAPGEGGDKYHRMWGLILGTMYSQIQIEKMTMGGRAFFPNLLEKEKRAMMTHGPREAMYTESTWHGQAIKDSKGNEITEEQKTYERVVYIDDETVGSAAQDLIRGHLMEMANAGFMSKEQAEASADEYESSKATDGIGLRSPEAYRRIKIHNGEWSDQKEISWQKMMAGTATAKDLAVFYEHFKPLYSGSEVVEYPDGTKVMTPVLHKYSEMMMLPTAMLNKGGFQLQSSPLYGISKAMEEKGLDLVLFKSGVKVGASYMIDDLFDVVKDDKGNITGRKYSTADAISDRIVSAIEAEPRVVHRLPWAQFGKTASLPPHILNTMISWSSQAYKLARANISARDIISLGSLQTSAHAGQQLFDQVESAIIAFEYEKLMNELNDPNRVIELLQSELAQKSYSSPEMAYALSQLKDGKMALPLFWLTMSNSAQQLITSIFRSRLTRHKTKGANFVQTTSLGLDDVQEHAEFNDKVRKLKVVYNDDEIKAGKEKKKRVKYVEAYAALHDDRLLEFADENGFLGPERIQYLLDHNIIDPKVLECIGYRTPSDAEHSIIPIRIVGFMVNASGADIILPRDVMKMTGHDYDGDKLRVHFHDFEIEWDDEKIQKEYERRHATDPEYKDMSLGTFIKMVKSNNNPKRAEYKRTKVYTLDYASVLSNEGVVKHPAELEFSDYSSRIKTYDNAMVDLIFAQLTSPEGSGRMVIPGGAGDSGKYARTMELIRLSHQAGESGKAVRTGLAKYFSEKFDLKFNERDMNSTRIYRMSKRLNDKELRVLLDQFSSADSHYSYTHVMDAFNYMMKGANMVSGFALYNSAFALLQKMNLKFIPRKYKYKKKDGSSVSGEHKVSIFGNNIDELFRPQTEDQTMYSILTLARLLNAAVDNGKDPLMGFLGQSNSLISLDFFLAAAGFNEEQIHILVNQPVVQEIKKIMDENKCGLGAAILQVREEFDEARKIHKNAEEEKAEEKALDANDTGAQLSDGQTAEQTEAAESDEGESEVDELASAVEEETKVKRERGSKYKNKGLRLDKQLSLIATANVDKFTDALGIPFTDIINPAGNTDRRDLQFSLLGALGQISGAVTELSEAVSTMRAESSTGSVGPNIAATQAKLAKFKKLVDIGFKRVSGLNSVYQAMDVSEGDSAQEIIRKLEETKSPEPVTTLLYELSMTKCMDFMSRYFPQAKQDWYDRTLELANEHDYPEVKETLIRSIQDDMMLDKIMSHPKFAGASFEEVEAKRKDLVLEFPYRFNDFKEKCQDALSAKNEGKEYDENYASLGDNLLIRKVYLQAPWPNARETTRPWLTYDADGLIDTKVTESTQRAWDELLNSNAPEARKIATDLLNYSIFTNGFSFGRKEFGHFAPFSVLLSTPHFVDALASVLNSTFTDEEWERFKLYYYLNHADSSERLVPTVPAGLLPTDVRKAFNKWYKENVDSSRSFNKADGDKYTPEYIKSKRVIGIKVKENKKEKVYYFETIKSGKDFFLKPVELTGETNRGGRRHRQYNTYADAYSAPALHEIDRDIYKNGQPAAEGDAVGAGSLEKQLKQLITDATGFQGIYESVDAANAEMERRKNSLEGHFMVTEKNNYSDRTKLNALWSDITVAFAIDFNTLGEKLTKTAAGDKYAAIRLEGSGTEFGVANTAELDAVVEKAGDKPIKLNVAGNGIYTLAKVATQEDVDRVVYDSIQYLISKGVKISEIRSGGQTGVDEAGTKAAIRLGIPWSVVAPANFMMRNAENKDVTGKKQFIDRFRNVKPDAAEVAAEIPETPVTEQQTQEAVASDNTATSNESVEETLARVNAQLAADPFSTPMFALAERVVDEAGNESVRVNGVEATPRNIRELRRQRMYVRLNKKLRELLAKAGVGVGVLDEMYERMGVAGVTEFDKPIALANGLIEYIRLAHGFAGEVALPEEFSHMAVAMLRGNTLVERLRNLLANDDNALRSAFNGQYEQYANDPSYKGNRDKLVEEAIGKLVQRQIVEQAEAEYHPIRNLVKRVAEAIKDFFRRMFSIQEVQDSVYDAMEISSKLARDLVSGRLLDQMDISNIKTAGDFKSISKDLSDRTDILSKVVNNESKRLDIYMKRLGNDEKAIEESPAIAATRATIANLTDQIWKDKTELALMGYMSDAIERLSNAHNSLMEAVDAGLGANEEGKQLNIIRDLIYSYSSISKAIREAVKDGEIVASDEFTDLLDKLDGKISNYYSRYSQLSKTLLMKMLVNVYGENGITVTLRGKTRHISIKEMAEHADHDINLGQRWFYSIANCDDYVLKAVDDVTRKAKFRARNRTAEMQRQVEVAVADYVRATGSRDLSFVYQRDADGHKTGKYITDEEIQALPEPKRKIAKTLIDMKYAADKYIPQSYVTAYGGTSSIVMMRKSTMDKVKSSGGLRAGAGVLWDSFQNSILETADDFNPEVQKVQVDFENSPVDKLPVHFLTKSKKESFDDMTDDAATAILAYIGMANEYDELNNVIGILENARYASMERDVDQGTRRRKQREIIEADDMGYQKNFTVKQARTNIQKILDDYFKMHLYGHLHADEGSWKIFGKEVSKSKVASKLGAITTFSQMAFNFQQRISNITTGKMQIIIEAGNGKFSAMDIAKADATYLKYTPDRLLDTGKTESDNKLSLWREKFDVGQDNGDVRSKNYGKKRLGRLFNTNIMFAGLLAGEDYMSSLTALALAENFKLKDSKNNEYNLFDAYTVEYTDPVNKTGAYLKLRDGLTKLDGSVFTEDDEFRFMKQVAGTNFDLQGIYNTDDRCAAQSRALGSLVIMYRKWIAPAIKRRYGRAQYDILRGDYVEGYYNTLWQNLHPEAIMRLFNEGEAFRLGMLLNWDNLTAMEKNNMRKALIEMGTIAGIIISLMLLDKLPETDDDNKFLDWAEKMAYYQLLRLKNELGSMAPTPMLLAEAKKILESPFAAYKPLAATFDAWNLFLPSNYLTKVRTGPYAGRTKAYKYFWSLPILSMRKQFSNILDPTNLINFYKTGGF